MATSPRRDRAAEDVEERGVPAYVAELLGTFALVLFIALYLSVGVGLLGPRNGGFDLASLALLHWLVLAVLVYVLGGTSGGHFNPAVTIALLGLRKILPRDAGIYIAVQLAGAVLGALVCRVLLTDEGGVVAYGATVPSGATTVLGGLVAEALGTFVLVGAIMGTAVDPRGNKAWAGLVIGAALGFAVMVFGPITGGSFNPARSFGPALVSGEWDDFWIYVIGPPVGALAAAFGYRALAIEPRDRVERRPIDTLD